MFRRVLIANRGEIARRIARTCRRMGIGVAAVYSAADADAPFVREADVAVRLAGSMPAESYLDVDAIVAAALRVGADAIHPGYGFLAENAELARSCAAAGVTLVGPGAEAIETMGSKVEAKRTMARAGVPMLASSELPAGEAIAPLARQVGFPLLVKASAGGGGKAMRIVHRPEGLSDAVAACRREALGAFGDETVFIERYLDAARHVEVQVFGDTHGNVVHLGERECSIQRRYQKVIEEAPSPAVTPALREAMGAAAVAAARAIAYVGAGTVEFLLAADGTFSFLEMNTRLQVEHPVTELVTGLDLVRLQLLVAAGLALPPEVLDGVRLTGHAIEARLYAEDPAASYLPSPGRLTHFDIPVRDGVRVDAGVESGSEITVHYDPMLAKVIACAPTRVEAASLLAATLRDASIDGVATNRDLLVGILRDPQYRRGETTTAFLAERDPADLAAAGRAELDAARPAYLAAAGLATLERSRGERTVQSSIPAGFRSTTAVPTELTFAVDGSTVAVRVLRRRTGPAVSIDGRELDLELHLVAPAKVDLTVADVRRILTVERVGQRLYVRGGEGVLVLRLQPRFAAPVAAVDPGALFAPMPGNVVRVRVRAGDRVAMGDELVVLEAMKMEHTIVAGACGMVESVPVSESEHVVAGDVLVVVNPDEEEVA